MNEINYEALIAEMRGKMVERPNKEGAGTLSGHAAGEPFEKLVYHKLKEKFPRKVFKQYEYLNDMFLRNPHNITQELRVALFNSPTAFYLLDRGNTATYKWSPTHLFAERQNDTADIVFYNQGLYDLIDVKTRNIGKSAQAPNIISAYKLAQACALMFDNDEFETISIDYVEIDWREEGELLRCVDAHYANLFKAVPSADNLYINWAAAMQIQFHVCDLDQSWGGTRKEWAHEYLRTFVHSAEHRIQVMHEKFVEPFLKYI